MRTGSGSGGNEGSKNLRVGGKMVNHWNGLGWAFPTIGVPILMIDMLLVATRAKDAWVLQGILPAFLAFGVLLGLSLILGDSRLAVPNAAIAFGILAIVPSIKYGFVYGEFDSIGHYGRALEIAQTGSIAGIGIYSGYESMPLLHIFLATTGLIAAVPIVTVITCTLFLEHFVILVLVMESARRMFPQIDRRLIVLFCLMTLPVLVMITGTAFGVLIVAMLTYVLSTSAHRKARSADIAVFTILAVLLIFSHFVTALYFLIVLMGYAVSLHILRRFRSARTTVSKEGMIGVVPYFLALFLFWLVYTGQDFIYVLQETVLELFQGSPFPSAATSLPLMEVVQTIVFKSGRLLLSILSASVAFVIMLVRPRRMEAFLVFSWLLAVALLMGGVVTFGLRSTEFWRTLAYASLVTPCFLCFLVSRSKHTLGLPSAPGIRVKATMLAMLVVSMVAVYPVTPFYPTSGGSPIADDNEVNSIYVVSGFGYLSTVYSSTPVITSNRLRWQLLSLHPELFPDPWLMISTDLDVASPDSLQGNLVIFDTGKSGTATISMRALVSNLTDTLGIVYTNGYLLIAIAA